VLRALAIAVYVVFLALAVMAARRGFRAVGPLVVVSIVFLAVVWRPFSDRPPGSLHWLAALAVVVAAAAGMTRQLAGPPRRGPRPYGDEDGQTVEDAILHGRGSGNPVASHSKRGRAP
jgi:hypothetical protein